MESQMLEYHIEETSRRFDEVKSDLKDIKEKIDDFKEFKIEMLTTSRMVSIIISGVCGIITMIVSVIISIKYH